MIFQPLLAQYVAEEQYRRLLAEAAHHRLFKQLPANRSRRQWRQVTILFLLVLVATLFYSASNVMTPTPGLLLWSPGVVAWSPFHQSK